MLHPQDLALVHQDDLTLADVLLDRIEAGEGAYELLVAELVAALSVHIAASAAVIGPALEQHLGDGARHAAQLAEQHAAVAASLSVVETTSGSAATDALTALRMSLEVQPDLQQLRAVIGDDEMRVLGGDFVQAKRHAPTRPHAAATAANGPVSRLVGVIDRVKDASSGRAVLAATDGSGILDAESQAVINALAEIGPKPTQLLEPDAARRQPAIIDAVNRVLEARGEDILPLAIARAEDTKVATDNGDLTVRIFDSRPDVTGTKPVVVYLHGGTWVMGDIYASDSSARGIALLVDAVVVSVEYRLAPEHPLPAAHDDVAATLRWLADHAESIGGDPRRIVLVGEEAGANLAVSTAIELRRRDLPAPLGLVLISPIVTTALDDDSCRSNADAKPLNTATLRWAFGHLHPDPAVPAEQLDLLDLAETELAGLPPTLVITAERDPLRDQGVAFADRLKQLGVTAAIREYRGVPHGFFGMTRVVAAARDAHAAVATLLDSLFAEG